MKNYLNEFVVEKKFINDKVGNGMFATRKLLPGDIILEYSKEVEIDFEKDSDSFEDYCVGINGKAYRPIDITTTGAYLINHSCDPNAMFFHSTNNNRCFVVVYNTIQAGEEITVHYGWHRENPPQCFCNSKICSGIIGMKFGTVKVPIIREKLNYYIKNGKSPFQALHMVKKFELDKFLDFNIMFDKPNIDDYNNQLKKMTNLEKEIAKSKWYQDL